jgi:hypothetical protein
MNRRSKKEETAMVHSPDAQKAADDLDEFTEMAQKVTRSEVRVKIAQDYISRLIAFEQRYARMRAVLHDEGRQIIGEVAPEESGED